MIYKAHRDVSCRRGEGRPRRTLRHGQAAHRFRRPAQGIARRRPTAEPLAAATRPVPRRPDEPRRPRPGQRAHPHHRVQRDRRARRRGDDRGSRAERCPARSASRPRSSPSSPTPATSCASTSAAPARSAAPSSTWRGRSSPGAASAAARRRGPPSSVSASPRRRSRSPASSPTRPTARCSESASPRPASSTPTASSSAPPTSGSTMSPLGPQLTAALGLPVRVANDAHAAALGELAFVTSDSGNVLLVRIAEGIGAGTRDQPPAVHRHGPRRRRDRPRRRQPARRAVRLRQARAASRRSSPPRSPRPAPPVGSTASVVAGAGRHLGAALAHLVSALNIDTVVLSGIDEVLGETFRTAARDAIRKRTLDDLGGTGRAAARATSATTTPCSAPPCSSSTKSSASPDARPTRPTTTTNTTAGGTTHEDSRRRRLSEPPSPCWLPRSAATVTNASGEGATVRVWLNGSDTPDSVREYLVAEFNELHPDAELRDRGAAVDRARRAPDHGAVVERQPRRRRDGQHPGSGLRGSGRAARPH